MPNAEMLDDKTALVTWPVDVWFGGSRTFEADLAFGPRRIEKITFDPSCRFPDRDPSDNVWFMEAPTSTTGADPCRSKRIFEGLVGAAEGSLSVQELMMGYKLQNRYSIPMTATTPVLLLLILMLPGGCVREEARPASSTAPHTLARIVFFGDSITEAGVEPGGYVTLVADSLTRRYPNRTIEVIGAGISGNKVPDLQARLARDVLAREPTLVVIYIGINDVWHFYEFDQVTGTERDAFEQGLRDVIAAIQEAEAKVLLCTPSVIGEDPSSDTPVNQRLMEYAEISRAVASASGAHLCDVRAAFEQYLQTHNPDNVYEGILTRDGVHLNDAGNRFVASLMVDHLRPLLDRVDQ